MPRQTDEQMKDHGANVDEVAAARELFRVLRPALRVTRATGRIDTTHGDKTVLGLYHTVKALTGAFKPSTLIIEALNAAAPEPSWSANKHAQHRVTCSRFADTFERANKDFNRVDFYASCGVIEET